MLMKHVIKVGHTSSKSRIHFSSTLFAHSRASLWGAFHIAEKVEVRATSRVDDVTVQQLGIPVCNC